MPVIWVPALLQDLTGGQPHVTLPGATAREVIDQLDARYPGIKDRLVEEDRLRPNITLVVNGQVSTQRLRQRLDEDDEIHFIPAISGGSPN